MLPVCNIENGEASVDPLWKPLLSRICRLKEALDHAGRWGSSTPFRSQAQEALKIEGLDFSDFKIETDAVSMPHSFISLLLGGWVNRLDTKCAYPSVKVPSWTVVGWVRKEQYKDTPSLPQVELEKRIQRISPRDRDESTHCVAGIPVFWAGEGKNRTQLFRLAHASRVGKLTVYCAPDYRRFLARPLIGCKNVAVMSWSGRHYLLPFGSLSRELCLAVGIPWSNVPRFLDWKRVDSSCLTWSMEGIERRFRLKIIRGGVN